MSGTEHIIREYSRQQGALEIAYIEEFFNEFPKRKTAAEIEALVEARNAARKARNFAESDRIRDELLARNVVLEDGPKGTTWRYR